MKKENEGIEGSLYMWRRHENFGQHPEEVEPGWVPLSLSAIGLPLLHFDNGIEKAAVNQSNLHDGPVDLEHSHPNILVSMSYQIK